MVLFRNHRIRLSPSMQFLVMATFISILLMFSEVLVVEQVYAVLPHLPSLNMSCLKF